MSDCLATLDKWVWDDLLRIPATGYISLLQDNFGLSSSKAEEIFRYWERSRNGYFPMRLAGREGHVVLEAVNPHLENFPHSTFEWRVRLDDDSWLSTESYLRGSGHRPVIEHKLHCWIHPDEIEPLLKQLGELPDNLSRIATWIISEITRSKREEDNNEY